MNLPTLSVVIATYNSHKTLFQCLKSVENQVYPKSKIEIIISDGGSIDSTLSIAKKFRVKIIQPKGILQGAEINRAYGVYQAKNEILVLLDHDNILPYKTWFQDMVQPLIENKNITGVETLRYHYDKKSALIDRYFSLLGISDPLPYYLGKADRMSYAYDDYNGLGESRDCSNYYKVTFSDNKIPTLGANGFLIRRKLLMENAQVTPPENFYHIDVNVDLIKKGFRQYAFVKNTIIHESCHQDLWHYLRRRKLFMEKYHLIDLSKRRYSVYVPKDFGKLVYFIFIGMTFVKPTFDAVRGYIKIHDMAWFIHPFMCFGIIVIYGYTFVKWKILSFIKI